MCINPYADSSVEPIPAVQTEVFTASATRVAITITPGDGTSDLLVRAVTSSEPWAQVFAVVPVSRRCLLMNHL